MRGALGWIDIDDRVLLSEALESNAIDALFLANEIEADRASFFSMVLTVKQPVWM